jgi:hypothetical protein
MKGFDCSVQLTLDQAKGLKADGFDFVPRYLVPSRFTKHLSKEEAMNISLAGLLIVSVFEWYETRPNERYNAGVEDGTTALECAHDVGQPKDKTIYFAVDYDAPPSDYDAIEQYFRGCAKALKGEYEVGGYGSESLTEEMFRRGVIKHIWQTKAWSKKDSVNRNIYQIQNGITSAGVEGDLNYSYGNEGGWTLMPKITPFLDVPEGYWAEKSIANLVDLGIVHGYTDSTFKPDEPMTRAEVAVVLSAAINLLKGGK